MPAPEPRQNWGILGGVFDPVHCGHIQLASDILAGCRLDGILMVPSFDPPHRARKPVASFEARAAMLDLALAGQSTITVSRIEADLDRPSYTLETLRALRAAYPETEFRFIIGADNVPQLTTWHRWEVLLRETKLLVGHRPGADLSELDSFPGASMELVETSLVNISSTEIRRKIASGITPDQLSVLVTKPVADYIVREGLYR
jgi:nicotinate-nucleotide adenylyltransferase